MDISRGLNAMIQISFLTLYILDTGYSNWLGYRSIYIYIYILDLSVSDRLLELAWL